MEYKSLHVNIITVTRVEKVGGSVSDSEGLSPERPLKETGHVDVF